MPGAQLVWRRAFAGATLVACAAIAFGIAPVPPAHAMGRSVSIIGFEYDPSPLTVGVGDTVTWRNEGFITHTVTADAGAFDSGTIRASESFSFQFTAPGDYLYSCSIHPQMHGEVIVKASHDEGGMQMTPMPKRAPMPVAAPLPGGTRASGPVAISLSLLKTTISHRRVTAISVRVARPGARVLLELYSREHFSWREVAHTSADSSGTAMLRLRASVHLPLRVVVPGRPSEVASISAVVHT